MTLLPIRLLKQTFRLLPELLFGSFCCLLGLSLCACENDPAAVAALFPDTPMDAEAITNFETIYSDSAKIRLRITGPKLLRVEEHQQYVQYFPEGAYIQFFNEQGQVSSTLVCGLWRALRAR